MVFADYWANRNPKESQEREKERNIESSKKGGLEEVVGRNAYPHSVNVSICWRHLPLYLSLFVSLLSLSVSLSLYLSSVYFSMALLRLGAKDRDCFPCTYSRMMRVYPLRSVGPLLGRDGTSCSHCRTVEDLVGYWHSLFR